MGMAMRVVFSIIDIMRYGINSNRSMPKKNTPTMTDTPANVKAT
jgi:hypothetical protein